MAGFDNIEQLINWQPKETGASTSYDLLYLFECPYGLCERFKLEFLSAGRRWLSVLGVRRRVGTWGRKIHRLVIQTSVVKMEGFNGDNQC